MNHEIFLQTPRLLQVTCLVFYRMDFGQMILDLEKEASRFKLKIKPFCFPILVGRTLKVLINFHIPEALFSQWDLDIAPRISSRRSAS